MRRLQLPFVASALLAGAVAISACSGPPPRPRPEPRPADIALDAEESLAAALRLAREERPDLDERVVRRQVDALALEIGRAAKGFSGSREVAEAIGRVVFGRMGYGPDPEDPRGEKASSLDIGRVAETRRGACLPIAILTARAASGPGIFCGVARAPGHALIVVGPPQDRVYVDPAERGLVRLWSDVVRARPWGQRANHLYAGIPMRRDETLALLRTTRAAQRIERGDLAGAEADLDAAAVVHPDLPEVLVNRGALLLKRGDTDAAREALEQAISLVPHSNPALFNLGLVAAKEGDRAAAIRHFDAALREDPGDQRARDNLKALQK